MSTSSFVANAVLRKVRQIRREKPNGYCDVYITIQVEGFHQDEPVIAEKEFNLCIPARGDALDKQMRNAGVGRLTQERFLKQLVEAEGKKVRVRFYPQTNSTNPYEFHIIEPIREDDTAACDSEHDWLDLEEPPADVLDECFGAADNDDEEQEIFRDEETNVFDSEHDWPDFEEHCEEALVECLDASDESDEDEFWDF